MLEESERKIEASLRTAAQKRRAQSGEDFVLHPADRRRLKQEVTQKFHKMNAAASAGWLKGRIPILTWGFAIACVLAIAGWLIWDNEQQLTMTRLPAPEAAPSATVGEDTRAVETVRPVISPGIPAPRETGRSDTQLASPGAQPNRARMGAAPQPTAIVPRRSLEPAAESPVGSTGSMAGEASPVASVMSDAALESMPAAAPVRVAPDTRSILSQPDSTFHFASLQRSSEDQPLTQFSLTPAPDGSVKVVDGDGSIYTGRWQTASSAGLSPEASKAKSLPVRSLQVQRAATVRGELAPQSNGAILYSFMVSGTNRGINAPLTFEGVVLTAQSNYSGVTATNALNRALIDARGASVSGKVRYPGGTEVRVEAGPLRK